MLTSMPTSLLPPPPPRLGKNHRQTSKLYSLKASAVHHATASQYLFPSSLPFTSNNSPVPLGIILGQPAAHFLLMKQEICGIKTCLVDATPSGPKAGSPSVKPLTPQNKNSSKPQVEKGKANQNSLNWDTPASLQWSLKTASSTPFFSSNR